jgi:hypothetical protein
LSLPLLTVGKPILVGFEVLTAASMKMDVFWVVTPCSLVEVYQPEVLAASIIRAMIALMMEAANTSVTLVNFYQTTRWFLPRRHPSSSLYLFSAPALGVGEKGDCPGSKVERSANSTSVLLLSKPCKM